MIEWTMEGAKERSRIKDKMKAKVMRDMIVTSTRGEKRDISPLPSLEKKKKKSNAEDPSIVATGAKKSTPVEVPPKKTKKKKKKKKSVKIPIKKEVTKNIVVKLEQGQTYASVLGKIRKESNPRTCNAIVLGAMSTKRGDVFIRLDKKSDEKAFSTELRTICAGLGMVRESSKRPATIEIRDLDFLTEKSEVEEALDEKLGKSDERKVHLLEPNRRNLKLVIISTTEEEKATKLEQIGHICVGFVSCRIRKRVQVLRCYRYLGYGHRSHDCKAEDRSNTCYKCGEVGHKRKDCTQKVQCFLCENQKEHTAGNATCCVFRETLRLKKKEAAKKKYG